MASILRFKRWHRPRRHKPDEQVYEVPPYETQVIELTNTEGLLTEAQRQLVHANQELARIKFYPGRDRR
jgi:hypothetical protein